VEELEVYMTREQKTLKGPRKGELETRVVPVVLFELLDVHKIQRGGAAGQHGVAWRGVGVASRRVSSPCVASLRVA
jgi:hypothetical protein